MKIRNLALTFILSSLLASVAGAQSSRQVSEAPKFLRSWSSYEVSTPLQSHLNLFRSIAQEAGGSSSVDFYEVLHTLETMDRWSLIQAASEALFMPLYEDGLAKGSEAQMLAAVAYLTGLASPLYQVTVTEHTRVLPGLFRRGDGESKTFTITYSLFNGVIKHCQTTVVKDRSSGEIGEVDLSGCTHYIDEFP